MPSALWRNRDEWNTHTIACTSHAGGRVVGCDSTDTLAASIDRSASRGILTLRATVRMSVSPKGTSLCGSRSRSYPYRRYTYEYLIEE
eukprot:COSAG02_NODE_4473_length_5327_cov_2.650344_6_plen_88_part_00